ncbi:ATP-binding protein [Streptomyces sp. NBC_01465]|uniref:ATP-binding protein n=1 Tax=Streptomyces sp. NBC_01465 TaxID=2903878 RepID=UPI002E34E09F|nr:LuxR C-terminal-related transcriptional regulator [Streptomyces sp. NBC_01465]
MAESVWAWQRGELPSEMTSFIGREREIDDVCALFGSARMVTLLGPGGVGKSRIAVRAAGSVGRQLRDGVRLVELAGVRDGELLPYAVGSAFGLPEAAGRSPLDMVVEFLREEQSLLVLDTCEHLVDACALFAEILLSSCPGLRLLLTSRQALDVPAEHTLTVAPLEQAEAVRLFIDRAAAARPGFALTESNADQIATLCARLDGIPLALELAAVRLRALPLEQVLRRLEDRFRTLGGGRSSHPRHQTLRTAIDWSHDLCTPEEQTLWARLSVFAGGFDLEAAEQVCSEGEFEEYGIVDDLIGLVDKSIVIREDGDGDDRYRMLDTIREYGVERLAAAPGGTLPSACRHRDHFLHLARSADEAWYGPGQLQWTRRLDREIDNFRTAMEFSLSAPGEEAAGVALAAALTGLWIGRSRLVEGVRWADRALAAGAGTEADSATLHFQRAQCLANNGPMHLALPDFYQALEISRRTGDGRIRMRTLAYLATTELHLGHAEEFLAAHNELLPLAEAYDDGFALAYAHRNAAMHLARAGDAAAAVGELLRSLELAPQGENWANAHSTLALCMVRIFTGDFPGALREGREALRLYMELPELFGGGHALEALAWVARFEERYADAALLMGASVDVHRGLSPLMLGDPVLVAVHDAAKAHLVEALGEREFERLHAEGEVLGRDRAVAFALGEPPAVRTAPVGALEALTRREREVALLVHEGLSNRLIAERLVISKRTADAHVEHILAKLGFGSRGEIAALVGEVGADVPR